MAWKRRCSDWIECFHISFTFDFTLLCFIRKDVIFITELRPSCSSCAFVGTSGESASSGRSLERSWSSCGLKRSQSLARSCRSSGRRRLRIFWGMSSGAWQGPSGRAWPASGRATGTWSLSRSPFAVTRRRSLPRPSAGRSFQTGCKSSSAR